MSMASVEKHRLSLKIVNIVVIVLCVLAILGYFLLPLWTAQAGIPLNAKSLDLGLKAAAESGAPEEYLSVAKDVLGEVFPEDGAAVVSLSVSLRSSDYVSALFAGDGRSFLAERLERVAGTTLRSLADSVLAVLKNSRDKLFRAAVKTVVLRAAGGTDASLNGLLSNAGVTDNWIDGELERIRKAVEADNATVDSVTDAVAGVVDDASALLKTKPEYVSIGLELDAQRQTVRDTIRDAVKTAEEKDGKITYEGLIEGLLTPYLALAAEMFASQAQGGGEVLPGLQSPENIEEILHRTVESVAGQIPEKEMGVLLSSMKIVGITILAVCAIWLLPLIFALVKVFSKKNPFVPVLWVPVVFGWPHFLGLVICPTLLFAGKAALARTILSSVSAGHADSGVLKAVSDYLETVRISFSSGTVISFVCALVLIAALVFSVHHSRKIKAENRAQQGLSR